MRFASFLHDGRAVFGLVEADHVLAAPPGRWADLRAALADGALEDVARACREHGRAVPVAALAFLPVIPNPGKILCVGLNYDEHRLESGREESAQPVIFARFAESLAPHGGALVRPRVSTDFDFEGELAVIIGRPGRHIPRGRALDHVAGYSAFNDGSVRDWQRHTHQFTPGKNFAATGGFGPWLVTADEMGELGPQELTTRLNGEVVQRAPLAHMIFDVPRIIEYCSTFTPLAPGDVIATGTPGGVGARRIPPLWMKAGDNVEVEIAGIGVLKNTVEDEAAAATV